VARILCANGRRRRCGREDRTRAPLEAARLARPADGELVSALDGNWAESGTSIGAKLEAKAGEVTPLSPSELQRATRDSVRALMMIRAYRIRGHLHANLDPLGIEPPKDHEELHPATYGFTEADYNRKIFIDGVLGLQFATIPEMLKILRRTYCGTIGFEFMHISDPAEKGWLQRRIEGPDKEITFTKEGKRAILNKLVEAEGFEQSFPSNTRARSVSVSTVARP
jgi:2-oxoglutarate dehydrogenase complex, dehydrogenase (E1) component, and related enzymes